MRQEYRRHVPKEHDPRGPELPGAHEYAEVELGPSRPAGEVEQRALLSALVADGRETAGDAVVFAWMLGCYAQDHPDRLGDDETASFLRHILEAASGGEDFSGFARYRGIPGVGVGGEEASWADFCAWTLYAFERMTPK